MTTPPVTISPDQRAIIQRAISSYGLDSLWSVVEEYLNDGWTDSDEILTQISYDENYQQTFYRRFPAIENIRKQNEARARSGQPPLEVPDPSTYVQLERGYTETLRDLPGNWATSENITNWISNGLSPAAVDSRITVASDYINYNVNPQVRAELREIYGLSDQEMVAYVLSDQTNKDKLASEWEARTKQANVGAAAKSFGVDITAGVRDQIAGSSDSAYTFGQAAASFANVAEQADAYSRLGAISGIATSTDDLVREQFNLEGGTNTTKTKRKLASQERARFNRTSAIGSTSLSTRGLGTQ